MQNRLLLLLGLALAATPALAQRAAGSMGTSTLALIMAGEFSKEESLYRAKEYAMNELLGVSEKPEQFEMWALAAATSGELTSLVYNSEARQKEGMVLAFYGNRWNEMGVSYKAYGFKDLPKTKAVELLTKLEATIEANSSYLHKDSDNNNVVFKYDDLTFLIYFTAETHIRVFWGQYDSEWTLSALNKTRRRLAKKI